MHEEKYRSLKNSCYIYYISYNYYVQYNVGQSVLSAIRCIYLVQCAQQYIILRWLLNVLLVRFQTGNRREEPRSGQSIPRVLRAQRPPGQSGRIHRLVRETDGLGHQQEYAHVRVMSGRSPTKHGHHVADAHHQRVRSSVAAPRGHGDAQLETGSDQVVVDEGELLLLP